MSLLSQVMPGFLHFIHLSDSFLKQHFKPESRLKLRKQVFMLSKRTAWISNMPRENSQKTLNAFMLLIWIYLSNGNRLARWETSFSRKRLPGLMRIRKAIYDSIDELMDTSKIITTHRYILSTISTLSPYLHKYEYNIIHHISSLDYKFSVNYQRPTKPWSSS